MPRVTNLDNSPEFQQLREISQTIPYFEPPIINLLYGYSVLTIVLIRMGFVIAEPSGSRRVSEGRWTFLSV